MMRRAGVLASVVAAVCICGLFAADKAAKLVSGPQVDKTVPGPFDVLSVNGAKAGVKSCLYCTGGGTGDSANPVAMVFAREASPSVVSLIKKIDAATVKNADAKMGSFVVFCSDAEGLEKDLKGVVEKEKIQKTVLAIDSPTGPEMYEVAKDADVTVVLYVGRKVVANYAFKKGELKDKDITAILSDLPKILDSK
jgi:hypothetical protein